MWFTKGRIIKCTKCKMESQESLKVMVESKMNVYQQHDCQTPKANADQVTKIIFFLIEKKEERLCPPISTTVCPRCQPKGLIGK